MSKELENEMKINDLEYVLSLILDCGYSDIDTLLEVLDYCENYDEHALANALEHLKDLDASIECNSLLYTLLVNLRDNLIRSIKEDLDINVDEDDFDIYVDYIDTHISYDGKDQQVRDYLSKQCDLIELD